MDLKTAVIILLLLVIALIAFFLTGLLHTPSAEQPPPANTSLAPSSLSQETTTAPIPGMVPAPSSSGRTVVPGEGFRGPTGPPHIIGPKSNPPNY